MFIYDTLCSIKSHSEKDTKTFKLYTVTIQNKNIKVLQKSDHCVKSEHFIFLGSHLQISIYKPITKRILPATRPLNLLKLLLAEVPRKKGFYFGLEMKLYF